MYQAIDTSHLYDCEPLSSCPAVTLAPKHSILNQQPNEVNTLLYVKPFSPLPQTLGLLPLLRLKAKTFH